VKNYEDLHKMTGVFGIDFKNRKELGQNIKKEVIIEEIVI
jgi:hypothetical protein